MEKEFYFPMIAIVAIVAIVGMVVLVVNSNKEATPVYMGSSEPVVEQAMQIDENAAGEVLKVISKEQLSDPNKGGADPCRQAWSSFSLYCNYQYDWGAREFCFFMLGNVNFGSFEDFCYQMKYPYNNIYRSACLADAAQIKQVC